MTYWVKDCDCKESGAKLKPLAMTANETDGRVMVGFNVGPICCAHCGEDWKAVELEPGPLAKAWEASKA